MLDRKRLSGSKNRLGALADCMEELSSKEIPWTFFLKHQRQSQDKASLKHAKDTRDQNIPPADFDVNWKPLLLKPEDAHSQEKGDSMKSSSTMLIQKEQKESEALLHPDAELSSSWNFAPITEVSSSKAVSYWLLLPPMSTAGRATTSPTFSPEIMLHQTHRQGIRSGKIGTNLITDEVCTWIKEEVARQGYKTYENSMISDDDEDEVKDDDEAPSAWDQQRRGNDSVSLKRAIMERQADNAHIPQGVDQRYVPNDTFPNQEQTKRLNAIRPLDVLRVPEERQAAQRKEERMAIGAIHAKWSGCRLNGKESNFDKAEFRRNQAFNLVNT
ncbi:hypothetical protein Tco_1377496 [Tanacetum coccineum]